MIQLKITRTNSDSYPGYKHQYIVLQASHKFRTVLNKIIETLIRNNKLQPKDRIVFTKDGKIREYFLCGLCGKTKINQNQERCKSCTETISNTINERSDMIFNEKKYHTSSRSYNWAKHYKW